MKQSSRTQYITLSIMIAVLFLLISLMPTQNSATSSEQVEQGVKTLGLVTTD